MPCVRCCNLACPRIRSDVTSFRVTAGLVAVAVCLVGRCAPVRGADAERGRVDFYYETLMSQRRALDELLVTWTYQLSADAPVDQAGWLEGTSVANRGTAARLGSKRYISYVDVFMRGGQRVGNEVTAVFDGTECRIRMDKVFKIQKEKSSSTDMNMYLNAISWVSGDDDAISLKSPSAARYFIPHCLKVGDWRIAPKLESVGGVECTLLECTDRTHRLWLDPKRNYAPLRREIKLPLPHIAVRVTDYMDLVALKPGIYLPRKVENRLDYLDKVSNEPIGSSRATLTASQLTLSGINPGLFVMQPDAGEFVSDVVRDLSYVNAPESDRRLEVTVQQVLQSQRRVRERSASHPSLTIGLAAGAVVLAIAIVGRLAVRHRELFR